MHESAHDAQIIRQHHTYTHTHTESIQLTIVIV